MAAITTVAEATQFSKSPQRAAVPMSLLRPSRGVIVLYGYGTSVHVERGHLVIEDGVGSDRYKGRFPRVGHRLERLVVIGSDGVVSLSALRWLADQNASFVMLERNGKVLATTGPVRPSEVRLRRAQALAHQTDTAFRISRELIDRKLAGQERVARESLHDQQTAKRIKEIRSELAEVDSIDAIRFTEARAAKAYWNAWRTHSITFPEKELIRVPGHWRNFGSRVSPLSGGSPRLAVDPVNAILNYLYALLETECRLAVAALGLDPGMGVLHMDTANRDSLACDLMEPIRPDVDAYVLDRIINRPLKRNWFFEERNGNCRLMADLTGQLAETMSAWARLVAPVAEWVAQQIASTTKTRRATPATRLTQNRKREVRGGKPQIISKPSLKLPRVCGNCDNEIVRGSEKCKSCALEVTTPKLVKAASQGRIVSHTAQAEFKRSQTQLANRASQRAWSGSDQPTWLTAEFYSEKIQPLVSSLSGRALARHLRVSHGYAIEIRQGRVPHPRHWLTLATLLRMSLDRH